MNTNHYICVDNTFRFCVGANRTRKPVKEEPNYILEIIKKKPSNAHNIVKARYNESLNKALIKLRGI